MLETAAVRNGKLEKNYNRIKNIIGKKRETWAVQRLARSQAQFP